MNLVAKELIDSRDCGTMTQFNDTALLDNRTANAESLEHAGYCQT